MDDMMTKMELFYSKPFEFSYSGLSKILFSPSIFVKQYIEKDRVEGTEAHLVSGKVVHCLLLDDGSFNSNFIVSEAKLPGDKPRVLIDKIYSIYMGPREEEDIRSELSEFERSILNTMKDMDYFQSLKTDKQRLEKIITEENISYFNFLKKRNGKTLVDEETLRECKKAVEIIRENETASELLKLRYRSTDLLQIYNEHKLSTQLPGYSFGLKGIIDNFVIDIDNKTIYINDLKMTGKSLEDFKETLEYYMYWMQAAIYVKLVSSMDLFKDIDLTNWTIKFHFIVIDKYLQVYCFPVTSKTMNEWQNRLIEKLNVARYHYDTKDYKLPMDFAMNLVEF